MFFIKMLLYLGFRFRKIFLFLYNFLVDFGFNIHLTLISGNIFLFLLIFFGDDGSAGWQPPHCRGRRL